MRPNSPILESPVRGPAGIAQRSLCSWGRARTCGRSSRGLVGCMNNGGLARGKGKGRSQRPRTTACLLDALGTSRLSLARQGPVLLSRHLPPQAGFEHIIHGLGKDKFDATQEMLGDLLEILPIA